MRKNTTSSFFEVFRRPELAEKSRAWWMKKKPSGSAEKENTEKKTKPRLLKRDTTTPPGRLALTFSREALVIYIFALVVLLIASHVWGYKRGRDSYSGSGGVAVRLGAAEGTGPGGVPITRQLNIPAGGQLQPPFHSLQIISGIRLERAKELVVYLKGQGCPDAFVHKLPRFKGYSVCVGRFSNWNSPQAKALKNTFIAMSFEGQHPFHDCFFTKIEDARRILE